MRFPISAALLAAGWLSLTSLSLSGCGDPETDAPAARKLLPAESGATSQTNAATTNAPEADGAGSSERESPVDGGPPAARRAVSSPDLDPAVTRRARETETPGVPGPAIIEDDIWTEDFEGAKSLASKDGRDILMDFTGSDWCGWCIRLDQEVFRHREFADYADSNFVLVKLDYPRDRSNLSESTQAQNEELQGRFSIQGFPTILLADAEGRPYAQTGYQPGGPESYIDHLEELKKVRVARDDAIEAASELSGVARARQLNEALEMVPPGLLLPSYESMVAEIVKLDDGNEAGLRQSLRARLLESRFQRRVREIERQVSETRDFETALAGLDELEVEFADYDAGQLPIKLMRLRVLQLAESVDEVAKLADALLEEDIPRDQRLNVHVAKLSSFAGANRFEAALEVVGAMGEEFSDEQRLSTQLLLTKANFLSRLGRAEEGRQTLDEARQEADPSLLSTIDELEAQLFPADGSDGDLDDAG